MKIVKRFITPEGKEFVVFKALDGNIVVALDPHAYQDIVDMPATINIGFGMWIHNYTGETLWFTVEGSGGGEPWSWGSAQELSPVSSGGTGSNHIRLGSRDKPTSATDESILLTFRVYLDSGYTEEFGDGYPVVVTYHWLDSDAMSLLDLDNFDGGTLEGWDKVNIAGNSSFYGYPSLAVSTSFPLSSPNTMMLTQAAIKWGTSQDRTLRARVFKSFDIPDCSEAYFIGNVKLRGSLIVLLSGYSGITRHPFLGISHDSTWINQIKEQRTDTGILYGAGALPDSAWRHWYGNWLRLIAPLPVNQTVQIRIEIEKYGWFNTTTGSKSIMATAWFDNLKVVYA